MEQERKHEAWFAGGFILLVLAVAVASLVLMPKLLRAAGGPDAAILSAMQHSQKRGFSAKVPGTDVPLESIDLHWARITVAPDPDDLSRAEVVATLDFEGRLGATRVSSLGLEKIPFVLRDGDWQPEESLAPTLSRIVGVLEARRRALEEGDVEALTKLSTKPPDAKELQGLLRLGERRYTATHWFLRSERDEVLVNEEYRLEGVLPDRPFDEKGARRLTLEPRGQEFVFDSGLM